MFHVKPLLPILLLLAACDTGDRRLFTDMSEAREYQRECLDDGRGARITKRSDGVEVVCN